MELETLGNMAGKNAVLPHPLLDAPIEFRDGKGEMLMDEDKFEAFKDTWPCGEQFAVTAIVKGDFKKIALDEAPEEVWMKFAELSARLHISRPRLKELMETGLVVYRTEKVGNTDVRWFNLASVELAKEEWERRGADNA